MDSDNEHPKLKVVLEARKDAEMRLQAFTNSSTFQRIIKEVEAVQKIWADNAERLIWPIAKTMENVAKIYEYPSVEMKELRFTPPPRPATYQDVKFLIEENIPKVINKRVNSTFEIIFTKDKELVREVAGKKFTYTFTGNKKRLAVLEKIIDSEGYVGAEKLVEVANSPTREALRKIIQGINRDAKAKLKLKNRLIEHRSGFGYRINKNISIINE